MYKSITDENFLLLKALGTARMELRFAQQMLIEKDKQIDRILNHKLESAISNDKILERLDLSKPDPVYTEKGLTCLNQ